MDNEIELNKLVLQCEDEDITYKSPDKMTDSMGNNIYAYVCIVMLGDIYISAAIVLAQSLINSGSKADRVCLITPDVSIDGKRVLEMYFNKVKVIDYVEVSNWRVKKQPQRKYLDLVFTKFHVFNLVEYKKIILIDADALVLKFPDHLFSLESPAGCLLEEKTSFISYNEETGKYKFPDAPIQWYEKFCKIAPHGMLIPKEITDRVKRDRDNSGIGGGLMLLTPKVGEFDAIINNVSFGYMKHLVEKQFAWPEQQYLTLRYSGKWHQVNPRFFGLQGYPHWKILFGLQYGGDKPFIVKSKMLMEDRLNYPDFILWHDIYREILNEHPEFADSKALEDANKMAALFMKNRVMSRTKVINTKSTNAEISYLSTSYDEYYSKYNLSQIYQNSPIHSSQQAYYYSDRFNTYSGMNPKLMFDDINEYEYLKPIEKLAEIYGKDSYYETVLSYVQVTKQIPLYKYNYFENDMRDFIMLEYAKCRMNMFILTLWPLVNDIEKTNQFVKYLETIGSVPYVKTVSLNKNAIKNLMFWMYNEFNFQTRLDFIKDKMKYSNVLDENNSVTFIFFDNIKHMKISGQNAPDKRVLRSKLLELYSLDKKEGIRGNDVLHINDYFYQTVEYSQMILNKNSMDLLSKQNINRLTCGFFSDSNLKMQTFRKFLYENFSLLDMNRIVIIGGVILYAHGLRKFTDIDAIFTSIGKDNTEYEKYLESIIYDNCVKKETKIKFVDLNKELSSHWRGNLTSKNQEIFDENNIKNTIDLVTNPRHHVYFQGIKIYTMASEVVRKCLRIRDSNSFNREKDLMDFIMISNLDDGLISSMISYDKDKKELHFNGNFSKLAGMDKFKVSEELINKFRMNAERYYLRNDIKNI